MYEYVNATFPADASGLFWKKKKVQEKFPAKEKIWTFTVKLTPRFFPWTMFLMELLGNYI